jgi:hypothetical protein
MHPHSFERYFSGFAIATALCALTLLVMALIGSYSQGVFQLILPTEEYTRRLLVSKDFLRAEFAVDHVFIFIYSGFFLAWALQQLRQGADRLPLMVGLCCMLATALLDMIENNHILSMLRTAEQGLAISDADIQWQMWESQVKFMLSYLGVALMGLTWPVAGAFGQFVRLMLVVQIVIGVLIFAVPQAYLIFFYLIRASFFVIGPVMILWASNAARPS